VVVHGYYCAARCASAGSSFAILIVDIAVEGREKECPKAAFFFVGPLEKVAVEHNFLEKALCQVL
jgi:hypothetical protein